MATVSPPLPMHDDDRPPASLRERVFSGMAWSLLQTFGSRGLSIIIMLVLARVLGPSAFGIVTIAFVILGALTSLVDLGVGDILVRRLPQDQTDYDSAFWVVLAFSLMLAGATVAAAGMLADMLEQPLLPPLLWILAATLPLAALELIQGARMRAEMKFKPLALRTLSATAVGGIVGIGMAFGGAGYWSLLAKGLVESAVSVLLMWKSCSYRPGRQFSWARWRELFASAKHLLGGRLLDIVNQRFDAFVVGARLGPTALGLYAASQRLYNTSMETLFATVNRVTLAGLRADARGRRAHAALAPAPRRRHILLHVPDLRRARHPGRAADRHDARRRVGRCGPRAQRALPGRHPVLGQPLQCTAAQRHRPYRAAVPADAGQCHAHRGRSQPRVAVGHRRRCARVCAARLPLLPLSLAYLRRAIGLPPRRWLATIAPPLLATAVSAVLLATAQWLLLPHLATPWRVLLLALLFPLLHARRPCF